MWTCVGVDSHTCVCACVNTCGCGHTWVGHFFFVACVGMVINIWISLFLNPVAYDGNSFADCR